MAEESTNALGLDFSQATIDDKEPSPTEPPADGPSSPVTPSGAASALKKREKEKPYINPDRVNTGGSQRVRTILFR